jgi:hypothetical protein
VAKFWATFFRRWWGLKFCGTDFALLVALSYDKLLLVLVETENFLAESQRTRGATPARPTAEESLAAG